MDAGNAANPLFSPLIPLEWAASDIHEHSLQVTTSILPDLTSGNVAATARRISLSGLLYRGVYPDFSALRNL
jgi:hypothetical protein